MRLIRLSVPLSNGSECCRLGCNLLKRGVATDIDKFGGSFDLKGQIRSTGAFDAPAGPVVRHAPFPVGLEDNLVRLVQGVIDDPSQLDVIESIELIR